MERANAYDAQSLSFMGVITIGLSAAESGQVLPGRVKSGLFGLGEDGLVGAS